MTQKVYVTIFCTGYCLPLQIYFSLPWSVHWKIKLCSCINWASLPSGFGQWESWAGDWRVGGETNGGCILSPGLQGCRIATAVVLIKALFLLLLQVQRQKWLPRCGGQGGCLIPSWLLLIFSTPSLNASPLLLFSRFHI